MTQRKAGFAVVAGFIRTPMRQRVGHVRDQLGVGNLAPPGVEDAGYATHRFSARSRASR